MVSLDYEPKTEEEIETQKDAIRILETWGEDYKKSVKFRGVDFLVEYFIKHNTDEDKMFEAGFEEMTLEKKTKELLKVTEEWNHQLEKRGLIRHEILFDIVKGVLSQIEEEKMSESELTGLEDLQDYTI